MLTKNLEGKIGEWGVHKELQRAPANSYNCRRPCTCVEQCKWPGETGENNFSPLADLELLHKQEVKAKEKLSVWIAEGIPCTQT